jgi:DNA sulfur modification protein DndD
MAKITFSDISIENFGPFRECQTLDLNVSLDKPVVLIKALNGSGKTTLLTALQIGLYGYKGANIARRAEYDQLIGGLQRGDATGNSAVQINLVVDVGSVRKPITLRREWIRRGSSLTEQLSVYSDGEDESALRESWDEFINGILPAELVQLFLFDGEKIEALANPDHLPDLLRRATEAFLGLGGIDALANDLRAVERRANLRDKDGSGEVQETRAGIENYEQQCDQYTQQITRLSQQQASLLNMLDQSKISLEQFTSRAKRNGLTAFQEAAQLRATVEAAAKQRKETRTALVEAIGNPILPLAWLGSFWQDYKARWEQDQKVRDASLLTYEFEKRDQRLLKSVGLPQEYLETLKLALAHDLFNLKSTIQQDPLLLPSTNPVEIQLKLDEAFKLVQVQAEVHSEASFALAKAEQNAGQIPAEEQLADVFSSLQHHTRAVASAESQVHEVTQKLAEVRSSLTHAEVRLNSLKQRLKTEFKDEALARQSLEAAARIKKVLCLFRERLLASKAQWLSEAITAEFTELLHKKNLVSRVEVNPDSYAVSIVSASGKTLAMERLSAGERQILAIAVLSALIRERKGRFPVVVDTPLARLDQKHRETLINNFFAKVSHQVLILSTDEEVHGAAYKTLAPFIAAEHRFDYDESQHRTVVYSGETRK